MENFQPTWLYVKRHTHTGLLYFGKTVKEDVEKYKGSGKRWLNHLRKHGNDIETVWKYKYYTSESIKEVALWFSELFDIENSSNWANLMKEDGLSGGATKGNRLPRTENQKQSLRNARLGKVPWNKGRKSTNVHGMLGKQHSEETKAKMRKPKTEEAKKNIGLACKGKMWFNNGISQTMAYECPEGYVLGRLKWKT